MLLVEQGMERGGCVCVCVCVEQGSLFSGFLMKKGRLSAYIAV